MTTLDARRSTLGAHRSTRMPHAIVMMLAILVATAVLTWIVPSGFYKRTPAKLVVPGSYHAIAKDYSLGSVLSSAKSTEQVAYPAGPAAVFMSIPAGMEGAAALVFMIMFIGGMFGVLRESGALDAGIDRLLVATRGNVYVLAPLLMLVIASGSTFLGLISEYLVVIPMVLIIAERLKLDALFATALVAIAAKVGYATSVTNPLALLVAQPIAGVPLFSGAGFRLVTFVLYLGIGIAYLLRYVRRTGFTRDAELELPSRKLTGRQVAVLVTLVPAVLVLLYGVQRFRWDNDELAAFYVFVSLVLAVISGMPSRDAAGAFLKGMQGMMLAALLVGLAKAVEVLLRNGMILDTIIDRLASVTAGRPPVVVAQLMVGVQMAMDVLIPSTSGKAAVTMPILAPIAQLSGVSGQVSVQAFIFGNGLTNMVTPTSGMLLAYLATGGVSYGRWIRFILPLFGILLVLSLVAISVAVAIGL